MCWHTQEFTSFHVVILKGRDGVDAQATTQWLQSTYGVEMRSGYLNVYICSAAFWDASKAKNTSHKAAMETQLARGKDAEETLLVNLGGDNVFPAGLLGNKLVREVEVERVLPKYWRRRRMHRPRRCTRLRIRSHQRLRRRATASIVVPGYGVVPAN